MKLDTGKSTIDAGKSSRLYSMFGRFRSAWDIITSDAHVLMIINQREVNGKRGQQKSVRSFGLAPLDMIRFMAEILESSSQAVSHYKQKENIEQSIDSPEANAFLQNIKKGLE